MRKHTRGPWAAVVADLHGDEDEPDENRWSVVTRSTPEYFVASIENGMPGDTLETEEANARLIAAAPDLLAACKRLLVWAERANVISEPEDEAVIEFVIAAIAKSEGRS